ncbi:MAG: transporter substrate-binding domain-containing protein [Gammaproteobacteria bacterium]|nr:transporter substrate-binding domain-containing protein [Gammaproteobacteria bacterium]
MQSKIRLLLVFTCALWLVPSIAAPLRVVMEVSPPHQTNEQGVPGGLTTAVVQEMLAHARLTSNIEVYPWARAYKIASTTPDVLIYNMARTSERENNFIWIGEVASYRFGFVKLKNRDDVQIRNLADAKNYVAGTQRDDFSADWLRSQGFTLGKQLTLQPDIEETWRYLVSGKIDILIDDPYAVEDMLSKFQLQRKDIEFVYYIPALQQTTWIAIHKDSSPELVEKLKAGYQYARQTAAFARVMQLGELPIPSN